MAAAVVISIGGYIYQAGAYTDTYFPNTTVNGMEVGGKTVGEVKEMIASEAASYRLFLSMRRVKRHRFLEMRSVFWQNLMEIWKKSYVSRIRIHGRFIC